MWNHRNVGAGGPSNEIVRLPEVLSVQVARALGGTEALAERLFMSAIYAFTAAGVGALAATLVRRRALVVGAGLLGAFNPFVMVNLPNHLVPLTIGLVGWLTSVAVAEARDGRRSGQRARRRRRALLFAVSTLGCSYVAANPPLLAVTLVSVGLLPVVAPAVTGTGGRGARRVLRMLARAAVVAVPLALWWLVPTWSAVTSAAAAGTLGAETDISAWSWTHANGSISSILRLVAKWSWPGTPEQPGVAGWLSTPGWSWLSWVLPATLLASPLLARPKRRRAALWVVLVACLLAPVAQGLHGPAAGVNRLLYRHVPGMWLLREPMAKIGVLLALASSIAWALALDGAVARVAAGRRRGRRIRAGRVGIALAVAAPLGFAVPVLTGRVVASSPDGAVSDRVVVPSAWREVADAVNGSPRRGKALVLPLDDYYQTPTTWGYYGTDTLARQLLERPVVASDPQAYIGQTAASDGLVQAVETALLDGDTEAAARLLASLGVSHVVLREDVDYDSALREPDMARPEPLRAGLARLAGARRVVDTDVAQVWELEEGVEPVQVLDGLLRADLDDTELPLAVAAAPAGVAITGADDPAARGRVEVVLADGAGTFDGGATWEIRRIATRPSLSVMALVEGPTGPALRFEGAVEVSLGGEEEAPRRPEAVVPLPAGTRAVVVDGAVHELDSLPTLVRLGPATTVVPFVTVEDGASLGPPGPLGDCNRYDDDVAPFGQRVERSAAGELLVVELKAVRHSACVAIPVEGASGGSWLRVEVEHRSVAGAVSRLCLWLDGLDDCAPLPEGRRTTDGWTRVRGLVRLPEAVRAAHLYLYADEPAPGTVPVTIARYRGLDVTEVAAGAATAVDTSRPPTTSLEAPSGGTEVELSVDAPAVRVGPWGPVGDCHRSDERGLSEVGIEAGTLAGEHGVRLRASDHSACVDAPLEGAVPPVSYEVRLEHRTVRGSGARICLWQVGPDRCAELPALDRSREWTGYRAVVRLDEGTRAARLFVYADGVPGGSVVDYRDPSVRPVADEAVVGYTTTGTAGSTPTVTWAAEGPARYRVRVEGATGTFVLALSEAWSSGWQLTGLPEGARARHLLLDGYRNGWSVDAPGDHELVLEYRPARLGRAAIRVSQLTAAAVLAVVAFAWARRRVRRRST
ncbi:MAG: hypothetical protein M5U14_13715 [Acidimicrobiia bacterium]|nr:hypothetical protein [Acidimicrobiia bacterium]